MMDNITNVRVKIDGLEVCLSGHVALLQQDSDFREATHRAVKTLTNSEKKVAVAQLPDGLLFALVAFHMDGYIFVKTIVENYSIDCGEEFDPEPP